MRHNTDGHKGEYVHIPVLWKEILGFVEEAGYEKGNYFVDCTMGEGGHSELVLGNFDGLNVIGFDRDEEILSVAKNRLSKFNGRIDYVNKNNIPTLITSDLLSDIKNYETKALILRSLVHLSQSEIDEKLQFYEEKLR